MLDVGSTFGGADLIEQRADAFPDGVSGALVGFSKQRLELGEGLLDRVEGGAVGRQQEAMGAGVSNGATDGLAFVAAEIVEHDDVAGAQVRDEELGRLGEEQRPLDRAIDDARSDDPLDAQPGQERHRRPAAVRTHPISVDRRSAQFRNGIGGRSRTRTCDPLIKSPINYVCRTLPDIACCLQLLEFSL
jgi:hypothetical protein